MTPKRTLIFTILYNRPEMFLHSFLNVITHARNATYVIWNNGEHNPTMSRECNDLAGSYEHRNNLNVRYIDSDFNFGLNAAKAIVDNYGEGHDYIMSIDEDVLYLQPNFQIEMQDILEHSNIGYVAAHPFKDTWTNGGMMDLKNYQEHKLGSTRLEHSVYQGPTGGWATMTPMSLYKQVGGYDTRPELFFGLDGMYCQKIMQVNKYPAIAKNIRCYHATGKEWNEYFGYHDIHKKKMDAYWESKK